MSALLDIAAERRMIEACDDPSGVLSFLGVYREHRIRAARRGQTALCDEIDDLIDFAEDHVVALKGERLRAAAPPLRRADEPDRAEAAESALPPSGATRRAPGGAPTATPTGDLRPLPGAASRLVRQVALRADRGTDEAEEAESPVHRERLPVQTLVGPTASRMDARAAERSAALRAAEAAEADEERAAAELRELHARIARANARRDAALADAARIEAEAKKAAAEAEQARRAASAREVARAAAAAEREADEAEIHARRVGRTSTPGLPRPPATERASVRMPAPTAPRPTGAAVPAPDPTRASSVASMFRARLLEVDRGGAAVTDAAVAPLATIGLAPPPTLDLTSVRGSGAPEPVSEEEATVGADTPDPAPPEEARAARLSASSTPATVAPPASRPAPASATRPEPTATVTAPPVAEPSPFLVGGDLTAFRQKLGASQRALAAQLGVDQGAISRAEGRPAALLPPALHRALQGALPGVAAAS